MSRWVEATAWALVGVAIGFTISNHTGPGQRLVLTSVIVVTLCVILFIEERSRRHGR